MGAISATAAKASSRDTVEFSWINVFNVYKTISRERLFAFAAIGKKL